MKELDKYMDYFYLYSSIILVGLFLFIICINIKINNERLDEHKRIIIAQQEQINKLILHAKYYERNKKNNN